MEATHRLAVGSFIFHVLALCLAWEVIHWSAEQAKDLKAVAELSTLPAKMLEALVDTGDQVVDTWRGWLGMPASPRPGNRYEQEMAEAVMHGHRAVLMSVLLATAVAGFLAFLYFGVLHAMDDGERLCARHMCYTSLVLFIVGVTATAMFLTAFKDLPVIGKVIFKFEAKGIFATIRTMLSSGNFFLGGLIFLLSVAFPLIKLVLTWCATFTDGPYHETAMKLVGHVGKWSMADVFVIAIILSCFAIDGDELTDASLGPGVYFFAAYVIVSLLAGLVLAGASASPSPSDAGEV